MRNRWIAPIITALAAGAYPFLFYYSRNYTLIDSWEHLRFFVLYFLVVPIIGFLICYQLVHRTNRLSLKTHALPFLNVFVFCLLLVVCLHAGLPWYFILAAFMVALCFAFYLKRWFRQLLVIQLILALIGLYHFSMTLVSQLNFTTQWLEQPDDIEEAVFKRSPNIYLIQPDGYSSFAQLSNDFYNIDNSDFEAFIDSLGFITEPNFLSNYVSTLSTNSALFAMRHHYYNKGFSFNEALKSRKVIVSENSALSTLKNNGYKTHLLAERPYFLMSRPKLGYDFSNFEYGELPYVGDGLELKRDIAQDLNLVLQKVSSSPRFVFMQIFNPGHINNHGFEDLELRRSKWMQGLSTANFKLKQILELIQTNDPNAIVVLMADHGGYLGFETKKSLYEKTTDEAKILSVFNALFSIKWDSGYSGESVSFGSAVNFFRVLFADLAEQPKYLDYLEDNSCYAIIYEGAPKGIYRYLDGDGQLVFEKHSLY